MRTLTAAVSNCLILGVLSVASAAPGDQIYARPGQLISVQGTRLNFYCMGRGSPTVVFDSGWGDWAPVWTLVQPEVAKWTRACSYDRAGAGFSEPGPMPRTEQMPADETYLEQHSRSLSSRPIRVLSTGKHGVHSLDPSRPQNPEQQKYEEEVAREQARWLELSSNARQLFTDQSSEYIPLDQPTFVVDAIREVYAQSR